jgi:hypothetical protein
MTYHINPETGRPNICRASIRDCRFGSSSQHFETKQDATAFSEKALSEEHGAVATLKKVPEVPQIASKKEMSSIEKELGVLPTEKLHSLVKQRLRLALTPRELEKHLDNEGGYDSASFYAYYTGNQEASLDYNHYANHQTFTKGACAYLALELNRVTGFPIVVFSRDKDKSSSWSGHAVIKLPNGEYFDISGPGSRENALFGFSGSHLWAEDEVTTEDFKKLVGVKPKEEARNRLEPLEKAVLAKICFDLIRDYSLNDPSNAGYMRF